MQAVVAKGEAGAAWLISRDVPAIPAPATLSSAYLSTNSFGSPSAAATSRLLIPCNARGRLRLRIPCCLLPTDCRQRGPSVTRTVVFPLLLELQHSSQVSRRSWSYLIQGPTALLYPQFLDSLPKQAGSSFTQRPLVISAP